MKNIDLSGRAMSLPLLGGYLKIYIYDVKKEIMGLVSHDVYCEALRLQKIFNFFDEDSELSRLNRKRGMNVSRELLEVLERSIDFSKLTGGLFDVTKGKQFQQRKLKQDLLDISCSYKDVTIDGTFVNIGMGDVMLDMGSIAKGYIVDQIVLYLKSLGIESACIDARGDMRIFGEKEEIVAIQHPRKKDVTLYPLKFKNLSVATSGDYNQYDGSFDKCHILGKKDIISVTVAGEYLWEADMIATGLFVMGKKKAEQFLANNQQISCLLIDSNESVTTYNQFDRRLIK